MAGFLNKLKEYFRKQKKSKPKKVKMNPPKIPLKVKLKIFYNKRSTGTKNLLDFLRFVTEYGFLLSIVVFGVFNVWNIQLMFALGILYYFVFYEAKALRKYWRSE